ncbi:MAG TPA: hypothetical protein VHX86_13230 [Tepidisphaeraceae bacterium]|nr:hypothetical protein [Tepidisphaeraceae bacterium]
MPDEPIPSGADVDRLMVPEELLRQLHDANTRLRAAREHWEEAMEESERIMSHETNVESQFGEVREAQKRVDEIAEKIKEILGRKV